MKITKPDYYDSFRCIASQCPDSCCKEWDVQVDDEKAAFYRELPGALGNRLRQVLYNEDGQVYLSIVEGRCPMWREDGLCRIQAELGEEALCRTCRDFPRLRHDYGDFTELALELSCPEAAKYILHWDGKLLTREAPGGEAPEYDREAMAALLASRETAMALLHGNPREALVNLLLYGYQAQEELDGAEPTPYAADPESAEDLAGVWEQDPFLSFFSGLEILTEGWHQRLLHPAPAPMGGKTLALARYLVMRYWLQAVSDYDLVSRVKFILIACILVSTLGGDFLSTAQLFSKEIENDADNVDAILDGAYESPALTDARLLGYLFSSCEAGGNSV